MQKQVSGVVTRYKGNGRKLGYPTANFTVQDDLRDGVYFGYSDLKDYKDHPALIFVGIPTTMGDTERRVEVHLLGIPDEDYYDQNIEATLRHYHRANNTFSSVDELLEVMHSDEVAAKKWFDLDHTA